MNAYERITLSGLKIVNMPIMMVVTEPSVMFSGHDERKYILINETLDIVPYAKITFKSSDCGIISTCWHDFKDRPDKNILFTGSLSVKIENYGPSLQPFELYFLELQ